MHSSGSDNTTGRPFKAWPITALSFGHFVVDVQSSGLAVLIPLLREQLALPYTAAAAIMTIHYLTSSVIQPLFGLASDRRPMRGLLPVSCALASLGTATALLMPGYLPVLMVVLLTGLGSALFHSLASLNAHHVSGDRQATGMSLFFSGGHFGYAVGPLATVALVNLFGNLGPLGTLVPGALGAAALFAALPAYANEAQRKSKPAPGSAPAAGNAGLRQSATIGMIVIVLVISVRSLIQTGLVTFIPLYYNFLGPENKEYAALLLTVFTLAGALFTLGGGALADRFGRKRVMIISTVLVLPLLLLFVATESRLLQMAAIALAGASLFSVASLTVVMAQQIMPNNVGLASGLTLGLGFGAGGLGASFLGRVADVSGLPVTMQIIAWLPLLLAVATLFLPDTPGAERRSVTAEAVQQSPAK